MTPLARPGSRAILIGTGHHPPGAALRDVPAIGPSLTDLASTLRERAGVPDANITLVLDPNGPAELAERLDTAAAAATDVLLVYLAGHGLVGDGAELYLATAATADPVQGLPYRAFPYRTLLTILRASPARTIAIVLDCCFAGLAGAPAGPRQFDAILEQAPLQGGVVLTAAARDEHALAPPGERYTNFTGALIRLLREGDPAGPRDLTIDHLYRYLSVSLPDQRPHLRSTDTAAALVLAPNPAYRAQAAWRPSQPPADVACPFRGLRPFGPEDARFFVGRDDLVELIVASVESGSGLVPLVGASGSGKTSVLRAGVVPALAARGWAVATMPPGASPLAALEEHAASLAGHSRPLLIIDQFEELFVGGAADGAEDAETFIAALGRLPFTVLAGLRADFYGQFLQHPFLAEAARARQVVVPPLSTGELRRVIVEPAELAELRLEEGLADTLLEEAGARRDRDQAAVLPLLSHALRETWQRRSGNLLTLAGYRDTGGIAGAVASSAEQVYTSLDGNGQRALRELALRMVYLSADSEDTRRKLPLGDFSATQRRVADALAAARLVTLDNEHAEFAHDSLLSAWPRLRDWISENRVALVAAHQLDEAAAEWERAARDDAYLYREPRLASVAALIEGASGSVPVSPRGQRFLTASQDRQRAGQRAARTRALRRRATLAAFCALVLVLGLIGALSLREHQVAAVRTADVQSAQLAADAGSVAATDPGVAARLAVAAYRLSPTRDASSELYSLLNRPMDQVIGMFGPSRAVRVATQRDGPLAAAVDDRGLLKVWDLTDPSSPRLDGAVTGITSGIALAARQPLLAASCTGTAGWCLWSVARPGGLRVVSSLPLSPRLRGVRLAINSMAFSPQGSLLAASTEQGLAILWSVATASHPVFLGLLPGKDASKTILLDAVAFSPDGRTLAQTAATGSTLLWSLADPARPALAANLGAGYQDIAFNPAGTMLAAAGDARLTVWEIPRQGKPSVIGHGLPDVGEDLQSLAFSPDGNTLAYGGVQTNAGSPGVLATVDLSPAGIANASGGNLFPSGSWDSGAGASWMAYTPSGGLLTAGYDGNVRSWRFPGSAQDVLPLSAQDTALSTRTHLLVTPLRDRNSALTGIWSIADPGHPVLESTLPFDPVQVSFLGSSSRALITTVSGDVGLWDLSDPRHPVRASALGSVSAAAPLGPGFSVWTSSAGTLASVSSSDGNDWLWRISGPRATRLGAIPVPSAGIPLLMPDGQTLFVLTSQGVQWWDVTSPARPRRAGSSALPQASTGSVVSVNSVMAAAAPASGTCDCDALRLYEVSDGHVTATDTVSDSTGDQVTISDDGRLLAAAGVGDNGLTLWTIAAPRHPVQDVSLATVPALKGINISDDDKRLVDWNDGYLQLWDITNPADPEQLASVSLSLQPDNTQFSSSIGGAVFAPSGSELAVTIDSTLIMVDTDPVSLEQRYCAETSALTPPEWADYASNVPYQSPCSGR
jgi:WD40 repeat protein